MTSKETVKEITQKEFLDIISKDKDKQKLSVVDFYAEWCMPCLMMAPVLESAAEKHSKVRFYKIDTEGSGELSEKYKVSSIPCIILFKNGIEAGRITGTVSEEELDKKISEYL